MGKHGRAERHGEQTCMWRQSTFVKVSVLMKANLPYFLESGFLLCSLARLCLRVGKGPRNSVASAQNESYSTAVYTGSLHPKKLAQTAENC